MQKLMDDYFFAEVGLLSQKIFREADSPCRGAARPFAFHGADVDLFELNADLVRPGLHVGLEHVA
jgi:hypothetical protein